MLAAEGFEPYARVAVMARPIQGMPRAPFVPRVAVEPYRNEWAGDFAAVEAAAMEGLAAFAEMGQPTGYEGAEGFDVMLAAREEGALRGFAQAMLPEGWINWLGVHPDARRRGIGRLLVAEVARQVGEARGTHLAALVEADGDGQAFLRALGFKERGARRTLWIRR
jgi:ribosomal protein S18 acetylase RimI-like enzyme